MEDFLDNIQTFNPVPKGTLGTIDRYHLKELLGVGNLGQVFRATDTVSNSDVAIKLLPPRVSSDSEELKHIRDSFSKVNTLKHPNIISLEYLHEVQKINVTEEVLNVYQGSFVIVMQYVQGSTLDAWRKQYPYDKVPFAKALDISAQVAKALDFAHAHKVYHSDINLSNIMITHKGAVKISDMGLIFDFQERNPTSYIAPELLKGEKIVPQTDQYGLASIFYTLINGQCPFSKIIKTNDKNLIKKVIETTLPDKLLTLSKKQNQALSRGFAKSADDRFASCSEFIKSIYEGQTKTNYSKYIIIFALIAILGVLVFLNYKNNEPIQKTEKISTITSKIIIEQPIVSKKEVKVIAPAKTIKYPSMIKTQKTGIELKLIPKGVFTMGSPKTEEGRSDNEEERQVEISKPFYCGKYEITQRQWMQVMETNPSEFQNRGNDLPVEQVSWDDCQAFLTKLCKLEKVPVGTYRLLTEEEWEFACRAGSKSEFSYGDKLSGEQANFEGNYPYGWIKATIYREKTVSVGSFEANQYGLHDMHGNVLEWCQDKYKDGYILRGGGWSSIGESCRSASRNWSPSTHKRKTIGLRIAKDI